MIDYLLFLVNVLLSLDETYGDIMPVRLDSDSPTAFVYVGNVGGHVLYIHRHYCKTQ